MSTRTSWLSPAAAENNLENLSKLKAGLADHYDYPSLYYFRVFETRVAGKTA